MKIIKVIFIIIVVILLIGAIGIFIFLKSFDINRYKPQIIAQISKQIDHPVSLDRMELEFSLKKGINVAMHQFAILEKEASSDAMPIVKVTKTAVGVDIQSYLTQKQVVITGIEVLEPFIHVVQNPDGSNNLQALAPKKEEPAATAPAASAPTEPSAPASSASAPAFDLSSLHIRLIEVADAQIVVDQLQSDGAKKTITIKDVDARVEDFGFGHSFPFSAKASVFSPRQNIDLKGKLSIKDDFSAIEVSGASLATALESLDIKALEAFDPAIAQAGFKESLKGDFQMALQRLALLNNEVSDFAFDIRLTDGKIAPAALQYPVENIDMHVTGKFPTVALKEFFMYIGSGKIRASAQVVDVLNENKFNGEMVLEDIQLDELIPQETAYRLVGKLYGDIYFNGMHTAAKPVDKSLAGEATFSVKEAAIKDLNVLREILKKLSFLGIGEGVEERLTPAYREALKSPDTVFHKMFVHSTVSEGMVNVDNVDVQADGVNIEAKGAMNLAQDLSLEAHYFMPADLARALISPESQFLLDPDGRLHIPFKRYRGPLTKLKIFPDVEQISKDALKKKGKNELQKAIFKALEIEEPKGEGVKPANPELQESQPKQQEPAQPSEKILIENVLDAIFKE